MARRGAILACALLCGAAAEGGAVEIGTLFHTPEERARLDRLRRGEPPESAPVPGATRTPLVTGYVRRSDGRNTVWVDGAPIATRDDPRRFDPRTLPKRAPAPAAGSQTEPASSSREEAPPVPPAKEASPASPAPAAAPALPGS